MIGLAGVIVPVATPLTPAGELDRAGLARLVEYLLDSGAHGLFANGSMGGFAFHTDRRQIEIISAVAEFAKGRVPVLAGISDTSLERVMEKASAASYLPVDAFVLLPPYYYVYNQSELFEFFTTVAGSVDRPLVLYENPRLAHNSLAPGSIRRLLEHPNILGVKYSTADPGEWQQIFPALEGKALICGAEKMMSTGLRMGFHGMTGGFHNVVPKLAVALYGAAGRQDWALCDVLQDRLNSAYRIFEIAGGWRGLEVALEYMGIARKATAPPFDTGLTPECRASILEALRDAGVERPYVTAAAKQ